jgi:hypothetical protein
MKSLYIFFAAIFLNSTVFAFETQPTFLQKYQSKFHSKFINLNEYYSYVLDVPDLDQIRKENSTLGTMGLPSNGINACGPTSVANILGFIDLLKKDNKYFPESWESKKPFPYINNVSTDRLDVDDLSFIAGNNLATMLIEDLGIESNTNWSKGGTNTFDLAETLKNRLPEFNIEVFDGRECNTTNFVSPTLIARLIADKNLLILSSGRYKVNKNGKYKRTGGHIVVPTGATKINGIERLIINNPSTCEECNSFLQDKYMGKVYEISSLRVNYKNGNCTKNAYIIPNFGERSREVSIMERLIIISPKFINKNIAFDL